ncbi:ficolin-2-like [Mya arenaria]|uniref:ficolin-2-like n=1 Tax=Mya arenaria TaxID=6604 RepID=UPI0022DEF606|nr:ficolin-2-like [Mya arenaria]
MGPLPMDCKDIINRPHLFSNRGDGVYTIMLPRSHTVLQVFCNMTHDSGGWTAFQRRVTNSPDFHRNLAEYKKGFGDINSNFWMGLENLKEIVDLGPTDGKLHGVVVGANDSSLHEQCTYTMRIISLSGAPSFTIETEANTNFSCTGSIVPEANGQIDIDDVSPHVATFATYDRDTTDSCAAHQGGGWWYYGCVPSHGSLPTNTYNNSIYCGSHFYPGHLIPDANFHCTPLNLYSDRPSQEFDQFSMTYIDMMIRRNN